MADQTQQKLQVLAKDYQKTQDELQNAVNARQKLEAQQHENQGVQHEFKNLKPEETIYKQAGPVLLKQDRDEALSTVDGRLEFIEKELKRIEEQISSIQKKSDVQRSQIVQLQTAVQQQQQPQSAGA